MIKQGGLMRIWLSGNPQGRQLQRQLLGKFLITLGQSLQRAWSEVQPRPLPGGQPPSAVHTSSSAHTHPQGRTSQKSAQLTFSRCQVSQKLLQVGAIRLSRTTEDGETNLLIDGHREEPGDAADAAEHGQHPADVPDDVQVSAHRRGGQRHA